MGFRPQVAKHHAVQFYGNRTDLARTVSSFFIEGLPAEEPGVIVATPEHLEPILARMSESLDIAAARAKGQLILLDAEETLDRLMVRGMPDPTAFAGTIGVQLDTLLSAHPQTVLRAYGEMVDILWSRSEEQAAIRLEVLWNRLAAARPVALLCGYSKANFSKDVSQFHEVCSHHSHIVDPGDRVRMLDLLTA
jgi:hypothetical protein